MRMRYWLTLVAVAMLCVSLLACESEDETPTSTPDPLAGGVLATFQVTDQQFKVWVTSEQAIADLMALQSGESTATIPNGLVEPGPGRGDHNEPYSWHLAPDSVAMADFTIEVCDGTPQYVEEHLQEWMDTVERYCPWSAELINLEDHR